MPKVAVIIPTTLGTRDYLKLCVESLRKTVDWDIIVVSNANDGYMYPLTDVRGITNRLHISQQGQCKAVNAGVKSVPADIDYIMVSNDDMYYAPDWNKELVFNDLCFSPNLIEPTNNAGSAAPFMKLDGGLVLDEFKKDVVDNFVKEQIEDSINGVIETGFNLPFFIRKDVWNTIGGYDEAYDPWGSNSDTDLQTKIELAGVTPKRFRDVLVYHFGSKSGTFEPERQSFWQKNFDYYTNKFGFNRDQLGSDTWYCKNMINREKLKYKPDWIDKYVQA